MKKLLFFCFFAVVLVGCNPIAGVEQPRKFEFVMADLSDSQIEGLDGDVALGVFYKGPKGSQIMRAYLPEWLKSDFPAGILSSRDEIKYVIRDRIGYIIINDVVIWETGFDPVIYNPDTGIAVFPTWNGLDFEWKIKMTCSSWFDQSNILLNCGSGMPNALGWGGVLDQLKRFDLVAVDTAINDLLIDGESSNFFVIPSGKTFRWGMHYCMSGKSPIPSFFSEDDDPTCLYPLKAQDGEIKWVVTKG